MSRFQSLGVAAWAWRGVVATAAQPVIWVPLLLVAVVRIAALLLVLLFHHPLLLPIGLPLVKLLGGAVATHYPLLYYALPTMFAWLNLVVGALVAPIASGVATLLFARAFGSNEIQGPWSRAWRCAPGLIAVTVLLLGLLLGISGLAALVPKTLTLHSTALHWGVRAATLLFYVLAHSFLIYTTAWIVLMGHKIWPAIRDSVRVTLRTFLPTVLIVAVPVVLAYPFSYAPGRVDLVVDKLRPEIIAGLLGIQVVGQLVLTFILLGAVTRLFLWRMEAAR